ncbi:hypothetical protein DICPUDRAFT_73858 [Dictyostelium purpureum]|uniref:Major facilitator superfamily (MFS) profile domain-containing protein n=1 Tax=Dictyostelium purpureum TaxID=5786 RepID=F0Z629_DICPU|nr:uncharacterized protein DICPUDRAFT_73858 [Dictyostelium purpureum]EGC40530.1 hypothetical protein DICPUDRAFT_73858 [Dictyostelium purpureum]|eukprot:XP_003282866.1 hypothetical protein DICPUDRAFT_73858 [Dictyostelium purpureum]
MNKIINKSRDIIKRIRYSKVSLLIAISFALFTDMVCYGIILPIIPLVMEKEYHKSQVTTGFLFSMFSLGCLIGTPIFGIASDRVGRKIPFIIGMIMLALSTILFAYGHFLVVLFLARFVQGLSSAAAWVIGLSMIADIFPNDQFGTASGTVIGGNTIGALIGPIIGGIAYEHFGYVVPFYISALFAIVDLFIRICLVSDKALEQFKKKKELKQNLITLDNSYIVSNQDIENNSDTIKDSGGIHRNNNKQDKSKYNKLHDQETEDTFTQEIIHDNNNINNQDIDGGDGANLSTTATETKGIKSSISSSSSSLDKSEIINYNNDEYFSDTEKEKNSIGVIILGSDQDNTLESINLEKKENNINSFSLNQMNEERDFYKNALKRKDVWILLVLIILFAIGLSSLEPLLPLIIENKFKKSTSYTSLLFGMFTLPFLFLSPMAGWLTDNNYIRRTKMTFIGAIISSICFPFISKTNHLAVLFIVIILIGSGLALFFSPVIPILTYVLDPKGVGNNNGKILSLFCVFYSIGICIGPIFSTVVKVHLSFLAFTLSYSILLMISTVIFNIYFIKKPTSISESF